MKNKGIVFRKSDNKKFEVLYIFLGIVNLYDIDKRDYSLWITEEYMNEEYETLAERRIRLSNDLI